MNRISMALLRLRFSVVQHWLRFWESPDERWSRKRKELGYDDEGSDSCQAEQSKSPSVSIRASVMNRSEGFGAIAEGLAGLVAIVTFFSCWAYAIATWGWFLGLAFGWIPSLIIAGIALLLAPLIMFVVVIGGLLLLFLLLR
jgi:hypothetical protein